MNGFGPLPSKNIRIYSTELSGLNFSVSSATHQLSHVILIEVTRDIDGAIISVADFIDENQLVTLESNVSLENHTLRIFGV